MRALGLNQTSGHRYNLRRSSIPLWMTKESRNRTMMNNNIRRDGNGNAERTKKIWKGQQTDLARSLACARPAGNTFAPIWQLSVIAVNASVTSLCAFERGTKGTVESDEERTNREKRERRKMGLQKGCVLICDKWIIQRRGGWFSRIADSENLRRWRMFTLVRRWWPLVIARELMWMGKGCWKMKCFCELLDGSFNTT